MDAQDIYPYYLSYSSICIDTRKIEPGDIFFCLQGNQVNGNAYAGEALEKGASYVVMDQAPENPDTFPMHKVFRVDDSLKTLQELSRIHRQKLKIPVIGITGSNGKTTTKELVKSILSQKYEVFATEGNLNNHIGVPLSLLSIHPHYEMAVIEMGANHQKEIEFLCSLCLPDFGLITNIGKAHLEGFGGIEGVMKGKGELYTHLKEKDGLAFVYTGDPRLMELSGKLDRKLFYGTGTYEFIIGRILSEFPFLKIAWKDSVSEQPEVLAKTNLTGAYNLPNILAGICIGTYFGLGTQEIVAGIEKYKPQNNRSQVKKTGSQDLILDFYNANPDSMKVALENFKNYPHAKKMVLLGDMFELGEDAEWEHRKILELVNSLQLEKKILIGPIFYSLKNDYPNLVFKKDTEEASHLLENQNWKDYAILIKGSRGMKMENLLVFLHP